MRLDCRNREDWWKCRAYRTFLDGIELPHCLMADDEEGIALCYATDEFGHILKGAEGNIVEVRGNIEVRKVRDTAAVG